MPAPDQTAGPLGHVPARPDLARLIEQARSHVMTPSERRAQRRSWIRGQTGATDEQLRTTCPELFDEC